MRTWLATCETTNDETERITRPTTTPTVDDETIARYQAKRLEQLERDNFTIITEYETVRSGADKLKYGLQEEDERSYGNDVIALKCGWVVSLARGKDSDKGDQEAFDFEKELSGVSARICE